MERKVAFSLLSVLVAVLCIVSTQGFTWTLKPLQIRSTESSTFRVFGRASTLERARRRMNGRVDLPGMLDGDVLDEQITRETMNKIFDEEEIAVPNPAEIGELITGTILDVDDKGAIVDIGTKATGFIPAKEVSLIPVKDIRSILEIGQEITGEVLGVMRGMPVLSLRSAQLETAWNEVSRLAEEDGSFDITVLEVNEGGIIGSFLGLQCFLPGSQIVGMPDESLTGQKLPVKVLDWDEDDGRLIVSQRKTVAGEVPALQRGAVLRATVSGLRNYGAFLELENGMTGLLHLSQISYDRVENLEKVFVVGQEIKTMVLDVDQFSGKIALSTRALEVNPGDMLRDPALVFSHAEETAAAYIARQESERLAREEAAKEIVSGLSGGAQSLASVTSSIESILASIVESPSN